ncbi:MAG: helix-turn-helix domain-containing protein [Chloroflexi bacterium]|nr:helix-turn-helix domain-containing protein [Chloroflexota bacterium]
MRKQIRWDADGVRSLRRHLGLTQQQMAQELGVRQQTISEWETGMYQPRGPSATLLSVVAERADFQYRAGREGKGRPGSRR